MNLTVQNEIRKVSSSLEIRFLRSQRGVDALNNKARGQILEKDTRWHKRAAEIKILSAWQLLCGERRPIRCVMSSESGPRRWKSHLRCSAFLAWAADALEAAQDRAIAALEMQVMHARAHRP
jgi:hypothetical protein